MLKRSTLLLALLITLVISYNFLSNNQVLLRRFLESKSPSYEEVVRQGNALPDKLVNQICNDRKFRFLTIGGKTASGIGLNNVNNSYPSLLCKGDVIAKDQMTPTEVAPCLKTLIGSNDIYDVIVLDLFEKANGNLNEIVRRLSNRFPNALIVNLRQYYPISTGFRHRKGWINVQRWVNMTCNNAHMNKDTLKCFQRSKKRWKLKLDGNNNYYKNIITTKENKVVNLMKDLDSVYNVKNGEDTKNMLLRRSWLFRDWDEVNENGHLDITRGIMKITIWKNVTDKVTERIDKVGEWDDDVGGSSICQNLSINLKSFSA